MEDNSRPAFPAPDAVHTDGMSLREYYAGLAMQGLLASEVNVSWQDFAEMSVRAADALLTELQKEK